MTATLTHPPAEDLGRFVEGTLDDSERSGIVAHIADCDECRVVVVDVSAFSEESAAKTSHITRWLAIAALLVVVIGAAAVVWNARRDPLDKVIESYAQLSSRPLEGRLSAFPYREPRKTMRGSQENETDYAQLRLEGEAGLVLQKSGDDATTLHAQGVAQLLVGNLDESVRLLNSAAVKDPGDPRKWSDLSAALLCARRPAESVAATKRALSIDATSTDALFNQALAWEALARPDQATIAFRRYLAIDATSSWAAEARSHLGTLKQNQMPSQPATPSAE